MTKGCETMENRMGKRRYGAMVLIAINALLFVLVELERRVTGESILFVKGGLYPPAVLIGGEWYRVVTACFLHVDITHLTNNLVMLGAVGRYVERHLGTVRYTVLYFIAGVCGNLVSLYFSVRMGDSTFSVGASGAVFGTVGALLAIALRNGGRVEGLKMKGILIMIALMLFAGFTASGINNAAHVGGLVGGFLMGLLLYRPYAEKDH